MEKGSLLFSPSTLHRDVFRILELKSQNCGNANLEHVRSPIQALGHPGYQLSQYCDAYDDFI